MSPFVNGLYRQTTLAVIRDHDDTSSFIVDMPGPAYITDAMRSALCKLSSKLVKAIVMDRCENGLQFCAARSF